MKSMTEKASILDIIEKLRYYINKNNLKLTKKDIKAMDKIDVSMLQSFLEFNAVNIVTDKISTLSHIGPSRILSIYPVSAMHIFLYLDSVIHDIDKEKHSKASQPFSDLLKNEITLNIHQRDSDEFLKQSELLRLLVDISILGNDLTMNIAKIDKLYNVEPHRIKGTKISPVGTFFQKQNTKYFKPKHNPNPGTCIAIEDLITKKKNYLRGSIEEIIIVHCPICGNKHKRNYFNIKQLFSFSKNSVTLSCRHSNTTHLYKSKLHTFEISKELVKKYKKIDLIMYIINNKEYYELSANKKITIQ